MSHMSNHTGVDSAQREHWVRQCEAHKRYVVDGFA